MLIALSASSSVSPISMARFDAATASRGPRLDLLDQVVDVAGQRRREVRACAIEALRRLLLLEERAAKLVDAVRPEAEGDQLPPPSPAPTEVRPGRSRSIARSNRSAADWKRSTSGGMSVAS